jgi:hypothetical protein
MNLSQLVAAAVFLTGLTSQAADLNLVRANVHLIADQTSGLIGTCTQVSPVVASIKGELIDIKASLNEFRDSQNPHLEIIESNLDFAVASVDSGLIDCQNDPTSSRSKILIDMYLSNIDSQLMIELHGVGQDLNKLR